MMKRIFPALLAALILAIHAPLSAQEQVAALRGSGTAFTNASLKVTSPENIRNESVPPSVGLIEDYVLYEDGESGTINFQLGGGATDPAQFHIRATSSNETLLPSSNIALTGNGDMRSLVLTPSPDQHGNSVVTLNVSDGAGTTMRTFTVHVIPVNDPPILSNIAGSIQVYEDERVGPIPITILDPDTDVNHLILSVHSSNQSVLPDESIEVGFNGTTHTLTLKPSADALGTVTLTLSAGDGAARTSASMDVHIAPVNDAPAAAFTNDGFTIWNEGDLPLPVFEDIRVIEVDGDPLTSAIVRISNNHNTAEDVLDFSSTASIAGEYENGVLRLHGVATAQEYEDVLQSVRYFNRGGERPSAAPRTISVEVSEGDSSSVVIERFVDVFEINDNPVATAGENRILESKSSASLSVRLDASGSHDVDDKQVTYEWSSNGAIIATGHISYAPLSAGSHNITLTVRDGRGGVGMDTMTITIMPPEQSERETAAIQQAR